MWWWISMALGAPYPCDGWALGPEESELTSAGPRVRSLQWFGNGNRAKARTQANLFSGVNRNLDAVVAAGLVYATGEGSGAPVRPGLNGLLRGRVVVSEGGLRVGGELDERTSWVLASRKAVLVGGGLGPVSVLSGMGVVERGLFGPNARFDVHVPVELVVDAHGPLHLQARGRTWWTVLERADDRATPWLPGTGGFEANLAAALPRPERLGPRLEVGVREEFGHLVWLLALGAGS